MKRAISGFITMVFCLGAFEAYADGVLNVKEVTQEYDQWCWAATSHIILSYYGKTPSQCQIADYTRTVATWHDFGSVNCCNSSSTSGWKCNYWNYNWGQKGAINDILSYWGVGNSTVSSALTQSTVVSHINSGKPFIIRWGYKSGGGHFIVGHGIQGNNLYYSDPWYGEGKKIATYTWVKSNSSKDWTHTNTMTQSGPGPNPTPTPTPTPGPTPTPTPGPTPTPTPNNNSCVGYCGNKAPGGCWCDNLCDNYGDCCADKKAACDGPSPTPTPGPTPTPTPAPTPTPTPNINSCQGYCGNKAPGGCWCDNYCESYNDCCTDKKQICG